MKRAGEALKIFLRNKPENVLNVGGTNDDPHTLTMRRKGIQVTTVNVLSPADILAPYEAAFTGDQEAIWCSHVLEHQRNPGSFLDKIYNDLLPGGLLAITVPPPKPKLVLGHVTGWNEAILLNQLVRSGFDCREATVLRYGYNISCILYKSPAEIDGLNEDLKILRKYVPKEWQ